MKTMTKMLALAMAAVLLLMTLASCSGGIGALNGTYEAEVFGTGTEYVFSGKSVKMNVTVAGMVAATMEGTYEIDGDKITFVFGGDEDTAEQYSGTFDFEKDDEANTIKIGLVEYTKKAE